MTLTSKDIIAMGHGDLLGPHKAKASKYRATPRVYNGVRYASKAEAARAQELDQLKAAGEILWWIGQPVFRLGVAENKYVADFLVCEISGVDRGGTWCNFEACHVEEVKGVRTSKFIRDAKIWVRYGPMPLHIITRGKCVEIIEPQGASK